MQSVLFITLSLLLTATSLFAQDTVYCVDLERPVFEHYDLFNEDIQDKKIIMFGEMHYLEANYIMQAELLMYLNKNFGVRHLLIEFGRAEAYLYNQYLQTGDEWYLGFTSPGFSNYEEFYLNMKKLYDYNLGLDSHKKLQVHGLDLEREPGVSATLYSLLSNYSDHPQLAAFRDSVKTRLDTIGVERDIKTYIYALRASISRLPLPDDKNKEVIDKILANNSFISGMEKRDRLMAQTFMELDTTNEVYLGQFGFGHTMLNSRSGGLANILNSLEAYQDKILVINSYPTNTDSPFDDLSDCPVFLYRFDPSDEKLGGFAKRGPWALVLKDPSRYKRIE
ncbi:hypothetical protein [Catalinimonas locisalis]|uniref:hypothetical protein n=1 Tax=Catalinimonas locisalis TaxID=3133978 RepID=UPI003100E053